jgi:hypothetical protein
MESQSYQGYSILGHAILQPEAWAMARPTTRVTATGYAICKFIAHAPISQRRHRSLIGHVQPFAHAFRRAFKSQFRMRQRTFAARIAHSVSQVRRTAAR